MIDADDESQVASLTSELARLEKGYQDLELKTLFTGPHDARPALMTIQSGTGGTDASDFAEMLMRMYLRWGEAEGMKTELIEKDNDEEAGIKSCMIRFIGENAYGLLRAEVGVQRLIRISPFNAAGKRQTSFAGVDVLPELPEDD